MVVSKIEHEYIAVLASDHICIGTGSNHDHLKLCLWKQYLQTNSNYFPFHVIVNDDSEAKNKRLATSIPLNQTVVEHTGYVTLGY